ncbi:uncharacterized protein LOC133472567 isoform X11 [Phyllopteryx taeniolatus]|uniref:uncharacterized protein LOC133472567 isoform X11 n=1 Tax=Phyllopteryx taeniolatus TaxID=161469 RepID=UPI002AD3D7C4|nr:uncharacterized protein LOC133472567 isoform X11 [Phyllopteryx taeniolatus]
MKVEVRRDEGRSHQTATAQVMETTVEDHKQTCCDHRVKMCARTAEYEEELCGAKEEKEPQRQLLDAAFNLQPRIVLHRADITEDLRTEWQEPEPPKRKWRTKRSTTSKRKRSPF